MSARLKFRRKKLVNYFRGDLSENTKEWAGKTFQEFKKWFLFTLPHGANCLTIKINGRYVSNKYVIKKGDKVTYRIHEIFCGKCSRAMKEKNEIRVLIDDAKDQFLCIHCVPEKEWPENASL